MAQPHWRLAAGHKGSVAIMLARYSPCRLARRDIGLIPDIVLDNLLRTQLKIVTSRPGTDPDSDYAVAWCGKTDTVHPGTGKILQ